jgi:hypothetical protein
MAASHMVAMRLLEQSACDKLQAGEVARFTNAAARMMDVYQAGCLTLQKLKRDKLSAQLNHARTVGPTASTYGHTDEVHKFKLWDKMRALEALAKHFGLVREHLDVSGWDKLSAQLSHARTVGPTAST